MIQVSRPDLDKAIAFLRQYSFELEYSTSPSAAYRKDAVDELVRTLERNRDEQ